MLLCLNRIQEYDKTYYTKTPKYIFWQGQKETKNKSDQKKQSVSC
jgi:hypothetical protein